MIDADLARDLLRARGLSQPEQASGRGPVPPVVTDHCPAGCTVLTAPDLPPLDPDVDYGREADRAAYDARTRDLYPLRTIREVRGQPMRRTDVPYWTAPPGYCRWCGHPIEEWTRRGTRKRQKRWHEQCVAAYLAVGSQQGFRAAVWERDGGVCAECLPGTPPCRKYPAHRPSVFVDALGRPAEYRGELPARGDRPHHPQYAGTSDCRVPDCAGETVHVRHRDVEGPIDDRDWQADHVTPLWAGGAHSLDNAQTLCGEHHKAKTRREAADRALRRRLSSTS